MEGSVYPRPDALGADSVVATGKSAASWPAIIAGAFVATSVSLILLALGSGLGITSILTSADHGTSGTAIVATTAIWFIVTQWISAGLGGYIGATADPMARYAHARSLFSRYRARSGDVGSSHRGACSARWCVAAFDDCSRPAYGIREVVHRSSKYGVVARPCRGTLWD